MSTRSLIASGQRAAALVVRTPRVLRVLARLLAVLAFLFLGALALVPWQQSVDGTGRVVAFAPIERQQEVDAPIEGRVTAILAPGSKPPRNARMKPEDEPMVATIESGDTVTPCCSA